MPAGGSVCRARRILVKFDTLDGRIPPSAEARVDASRAQRRVFAIAPYPLFAVIASPATATSCAALRNFGQLDPRAPGEALAMVDMLRAAGRGTRTTIVSLTCIIDTVEPRACDAEQAIRSIDWTGLTDVSRTTFTGEPLTWNVKVAAGREVWTLITTPVGEAARGQWQVKMLRGYPAPF